MTSRCIPLLLFLLVVSVSCAPLKPDEVSLWGPIWVVPRRDIPLIVAAARAGDPKFRSGDIREVRVISRSEVYVYLGPSLANGDGVWAVIRHVDGRWRYIATQDRLIVG